MCTLSISTGVESLRSRLMPIVTSPVSLCSRCERMLSKLHAELLYGTLLSSHSLYNISSSSMPGGFCSSLSSSVGSCITGFNTLGSVGSLAVEVSGTVFWSQNTGGGGDGECLAVMTFRSKLCSR
mgnify:CR=1 FL=1